MTVSQLDIQKSTEPKPMERLDVRPRSPWRRIFRRVFWLSLMFVVGAIAGGAGSAIMIDRMRHEILAHPEKLPDRLMTTIRHDAGSTLTESQDRAIREIIDRHHARFMKLHNEFHPQVKSELDALETDIGAVLTEEQRNLWLPRFRFVRQRMMP